ncbi:MAG TPA: hypothetical protein VGO58_18455 [Chitinophagaceae bacterium]|jgi:hypothetical protein|nr:hypothetical protein [Chitinophagaceae bacterium]
MKNKVTPLVDEYLESLSGMQEAGTDDFFYTRLKARMDRQGPSQGWSLPVRPVWVAGILFVFLALNSFMLLQRSRASKIKTTTSSSSLQKFAESYDQVISSSY